MLQSLLYVWGPFLLQAGIGLAFVIVAVAVVVKVVVPKADLIRRQRALVDAERGLLDMRRRPGVEERLHVACALEVAMHGNALLRDALPDGIVRAVLELEPLDLPPSNRKSLT